MARMFFSCVGILPEKSDAFVAVAGFRLHPRRWETTVFDLATLASRHRLHFSWHLMEAFLNDVHCEIEVEEDDLAIARDRARVLQTMLYLGGLSPFLMPFATSHSINEYSGINSRDSGESMEHLDPGLRGGITSDRVTIEGWLHEPTLWCFAIPDRFGLSQEQFFIAATKAGRWEQLERQYAELATARRALQTAPAIHDRSSSLLHIWQGIEGLFPDVQTEVSFRLSMLVAQLGRAVADPVDLYRKVREAYSIRSKAAHGRISGIGESEWLSAWELLVLCMRSVEVRKNLPTERDLIAELLSSSSSSAFSAVP